jgi:hypothetical protein
MQVKIATLADYTSVSEGGKLNILGIFSILWAANVPVVHPQMQLVLQLEFDPSEAGERDIKVVLVDEDGREILSLSGTFSVPTQPGPEPIGINYSLGFANVVFPKYGRYAFKILIGGDLKSEVPLSVLQTKPAA